MKILVLNEEEIKSIYTMAEAVEASKEALAYYSKGRSINPLRVNINVEKYKGDSLYMPGLVEDLDALGVKIVSTYPGNREKGLTTVPSTMVLVNAEDGQVKSIMDGTYLTRLRTGAVAGAATDLLARKDSKIFLMFGTGGQAREQLEAVLSVRDIEEAVIFGGRNKDKTQAFVEEMQRDLGEKYKLKIRMGEDREEEVKRADIITTVTSSKTPTFKGSLVKKGSHINGVGSYTEEMVEMDEDTICQCDKLYADTLEGVIMEAGDFIAPLSSGKLKKEDIEGELGQLILGEIKGREGEEEITVFKTTGAAVLDLVTAEKIYRKAIEKGIGQTIEI